MLTAEFGGTGGKSIESGIVVEEPDIEIGAGVSSKGTVMKSSTSLEFPLISVAAISRRMQTDRGGQQGPRSTRDPPPASRFRVPERKEENERSNSNTGVPPTVPNFNFQFPLLPNGMPMFPPGFVMPGQTPAQPPPPGAN